MKPPVPAEPPDAAMERAPTDVHPRSGYARVIELERERDALRAENERLRAVVEAARVMACAAADMRTVNRRGDRLRDALEALDALAALGADGGR